MGEKEATSTRTSIRAAAACHHADYIDTLLDAGNDAGVSRCSLGLDPGLNGASIEEGLNELGEAPPAYTPNDGQQRPTTPEVRAGNENTSTNGNGDGTGSGTGVALTTCAQTTAEAGISWRPPSYNEEFHTAPTTPRRLRG